MRDGTVMLHRIIWLREHGEEGRASARLLSSKAGGDNPSQQVAMKPGRILGVPERRRARTCHGAGSTENLGTGDKKRRAYVPPYGENETGRRSKDLNIICDTTTSQDTASYKMG